MSRDKDAKIGSLVLILNGPYEGFRGYVRKLDRRGEALIEVSTGPDKGEKTKVLKGNYKVIT